MNSDISKRTPIYNQLGIQITMKLPPNHERFGLILDEFMTQDMFFFFFFFFFCGFLPQASQWKRLDKNLLDLVFTLPFV